MIRLIVVIGVMMGMLVLVAPSLVQAQAMQAQDLCLARWAWVDGEWNAPFPGNRLGTIDLRSTPQHGPGPIAQGWALFSYDQPMGSTGLHCMGGDLDTAISTAQADTLAVLLEMGMGDLRARTMRGVIAELFISHADPTGVDRWKPFQITRKGLNIHLGGYGNIYGERFSETSRAMQNTLDIRHADYRRMRGEGVPVAQLQRQTGFDSFRLFGRAPTSADLNRLLPTEYRSDGAACIAPQLCTTITESFNTADSDILGPDQTWTEVLGDFDIVSNQARSEGTDDHARAESDIAGSDMYAQANTFNDVAGTSRGNGTAVRFSASADTFYYVGANSDGAQIIAYLVQEVVAGSGTTIATFSGFTDVNGGIVRLEIIGSNLEVFYAGVSRGTVSDATITGNTRGGFASRHNGTQRTRIDNWELADIVTASRRVIRIN